MKIWILISSLLLAVQSLAGQERFKEFLFGVDYYPEHWPEHYWEQDARRMKDCGVNAVRLGEFAWYYFEPEEGVYQFDLFDRAIEILGRQDIKVILGTPSAAPPKWLTHRYPSVLYVGKDGRAWNDQGRRHYNYNDPVYRDFCSRIVTQMAEHYRDNPYVVGWQIDNEFNCIIDEFYSDADRHAFRSWLQQKYVHLDSLNERWGTQFWSQWYTDWEQIDVPFRTPAAHNPSLILDFKRFVSGSVISFQKIQVDIIRQLCPGMFITHNDYHAWNIDFYRLSEDLDIFALDNYPCFHNPPQYKIGHFLTMARGFKGRFMIMEQQAGPGGSSDIQWSPRPGQMRLWAYQALAHGADGIIHFRWRTARKGIETYWHGILDQDNKPRWRFEEFKQEGLELRRISDEIFGTTIKSDVAVLRDFDNEWALKYQNISDELDVRDAYDHFFKAASQMHMNIDFIPTRGDFSGYRIVVMPLHILMNKPLADRLTAYVEHGGVLIINAHSAVKNDDNAMTDQVFPAYLHDLFGVERAFFHRYDEPSYGKNEIVFESGEKASVYIMAEGLQLNGAEAVATWGRDYFEGKPAVTENRVGKGKAVYHASFFDETSARLLLERYAKELRLKPLLGHVPESIEITRRSGEKSDYYFALNHSPDPVKLHLDRAGYDMLHQRQVRDEVTLAGYDVLILRSVGE